MKKIYVNKTDSAASVIERVISVSDKEVTLSIPRGTEFSKLKNNFRLLKREAAQAGKEVTIESVEEITLDSASSVGIKSVNPFFGQKTRLVSDIVMNTEVDGPMDQTKRQKVQQPKEEPRAEESEGEEAVFTAREFYEQKTSIWTEEEEHPHSRKLTVILAVLAVVLVAIGVALYFTLPEATITLTLAETPYDYTGPLYVNSNVQEASASSSSITIPGTVFSDTENYVVDFTPSGSKNVSLDAAGTIDIYNDYSASPQVLVKTTRFTAPNGDIYRLDNTITVPGATVSGGVVTPAYVQASVTADQPGAGYNISTSTTFRIPGFQNTAKYNGFYAESAGPIQGGFVGVMPVPTTADLAAASTTANNNLDSALYNELVLKLPTGVKTVASSSQITITSENVSPTPNSQGQYALTINGTIKLFAFRESDLLSVLANEVEVANQASSTNLSLYNYSASYSNAQPNFKTGVMTLSLDLNSNWAATFGVASFQNRAEGLDDSALKTLIFSLPGVKDANVQLWPFWVTTVPQNPSKIHVDVEYAS